MNHHLSRPTLFFLALTLCTQQACTWVEPDAQGELIRVAYHKADIANCVDLQRSVTVSVKHDIAGIERNKLKVADELESLARNEAATITQADTIFASSTVYDGEQKFDVYDCK
jgi:hypothetical protein